VPVQSLSHPGAAGHWRRSHPHPRPTSAPAACKKGAEDNVPQQRRYARGSAQPHFLSSAATADLSDILTRKIAVRDQAARMQQEIHALNVALSSQVERFLRPELRGKGLLSEIVVDEETRISDEDRLLAAVRRADLDVVLRVKAMLVLGKICAEREVGGSKAEIIEVGAAALHEIATLLDEPWTALELADVFDGVGLTDVAETILKELERDVLRGGRCHHPYMLVDLAERHHCHDRIPRARFLWKRACAARPRDPRTLTRLYRWRFDAEPPVPDDDFRVLQPDSAADKDLKFRRPLGGLLACCPCGHGVAKEPEACPKDAESLTVSEHSLYPLLQQDGVLPDHVRRELDRIGLAGGLADLASAPQGLVARPTLVLASKAKAAFGSPATTASRCKDAEWAAWQMVRSRRFQVRIIDGSTPEPETGNAGSNSSDEDACSDFFEEECIGVSVDS